MPTTLSLRVRRILVEDSLGELEATLREFNRWILIDEAVVEATEGLVSLFNTPIRSIELHFYHVLSVSSMIGLISDHLCIADLHLQRYLEEDAALACAILRASLYVVDEGLPWVEDVAEFALHGNGMLEDSLVDLDRINLLSQLTITLFNVRYRL